METRARPPLVVVRQNILTLAGQLWKAEVMLRFLFLGLWLEFEAALEGRHPTGPHRLWLGTEERGDGLVMSRFYPGRNLCIY